MIIKREDPRYWDVRTRERRLRRNEIHQNDIDAHLSALPDVAEKGTVSKPLEEPDERRLHRINPLHPRVIMPTRGEDDDDLDDLDDDDLDDDDLDDDDDDDDDLPLK